MPRGAWLAAAFGPVAGVVGYIVWWAHRSYQGYCGLLDAGWDCSKAEYVVEVLLVSPFLAPTLVLYSLCWLLLVALAAIGAHLLRGRTRPY